MQRGLGVSTGLTRCGRRFRTQTQNHERLHQDRESNRLTEDNKLNRVDILALNSAGELLLVEVQNSSENDYFHRMLFGVSTLLTQYLDKGEPYSKLKKVY
ncbi:PD-(D/E)XK nuclease family transposase [Moorena producens]|uniref:PD-(D/E)XK nuclease family transposase n=1 Tax=Moorena producens TaxID=1155739 RepID=UPI003C774063